MSNFLSAPYEKNTPRTDDNFNLLAKVMEVKQGRYDANKAKIDQTLALYQNNLRGLRDEDNQYIAERIKEAQNIINNYGNRDFSSTTNTETLLSSLRSITEDPIVQSAVLAKAKKDAYDLKVDEIRKKDPKLYSDMNYQDSLEVGGVRDYMEGKTNRIGELKYTPYVNLQEKYNKFAQEYSDKMGFEKLLDSTSGQYVITDTKGKRVSQEEIYNAMKSNMDSNDLQQLNINARQTLGKLDKQSLAKIADPTYKKELDEIAQKKASLEAQIQTETNTEKKKELSLQLEATNQEINTKKTAIENKTYDIYELYQKSFLTDISSNYDINEITDVDRSTIPLDILKFEFDQLKEASKKKQEEDLQSPTTIQKPQTGEEQKSSEKIFYESFNSADKALESYLIETNENGYVSKTPAERFAYKKALKTGDPTMPIEKQNLIKNFSTLLQGKVNIINESSNLLMKTTAKMYDSFTGAKIENLSTEMPYTVAMLKAKKKFQDLDKNQQMAVALEMGSNTAKYIADKDENTVLMSTLNSFEYKLKNHKSQKVKQIYDIASGAYKNINKRAVTPISAGKNISAFIIRPGMIPQLFQQDTDLTEIESTDYFSKADATEDGFKLFKGMSSELLRKSREISDKYKTNLVSQRAMAWSTQDQNQKTEAIRIQQAIQTQYPDLKMPESNNFIVSRKGDAFEISFDAKEGDGTVRITKIVDTLSDQTLEKFNLKEQSWNSSFMNPNIVLPTFDFNVKTSKDSLEMFKKVSLNRPDIIPKEKRAEVLNRGGVFNTPFQSDMDIMDWVESNYKNITKNQQEEISKIINTQYKAKFEVVNGSLEGTIDVGEKDITFYPNQTELDEGKLYIETMLLVNQYKTKAIENILSK